MIPHVILNEFQQMFSVVCVQFNINRTPSKLINSCTASLLYCVSCGNRLKPALYCAEVLLANTGEK